MLIRSNFLKIIDHGGVNIAQSGATVSRDSARADICCTLSISGSSQEYQAIGRHRRCQPSFCIGARNRRPRCFRVCLRRGGCAGVTAPPGAAGSTARHRKQCAMPDRHPGLDVDFPDVFVTRLPVRRSYSIDKLRNDLSKPRTVKRLRSCHEDRQHRDNSSQ